MLCQICSKNEATIHYKSNENGHFFEKHMCKECAEKDGYMSKDQFFAFDNFSILDDFFDNTSEGMLGGLFKNMMDGPSAKSIGDGRICKTCGLRFSDFLKHGRLGCTNCYKTFSSSLEPTIKRIHGNIFHNGKFPVGRQEKLEKENKLENLRQTLKQAIEAQEYEKAAEYRDQIRELEKQSDNNKKEGV